MDMPVNEMNLTEIEKQKARELLDELNDIKGPGGLPNWNIKAQTLLVFIAARNAEAFLETDK